MELYGGGMVGKSTNYQLGGRIASAKRRRGFQGERRKAIEQAERDAKRQSRASGLGSLLSTVGSIAGSFIPIPGVGTSLGAAIGSGLGSGLGILAGESTYKGSDFGDGKYLKQSRKDLQRASDDFADSRGERAFTQGLTSAVKSYAPSFTDAARDFGIGGKKFGEEITAASKALDYGPDDYNPFALENQLGDAIAADGTILKGGGDYVQDFWDTIPMEKVARPDVPIDTSMASDLFNYATDAPDMTELFSGNLDMSDLVDPEDAFSTFMPALDFSPLSYEDFIQGGLRQGPLLKKKRKGGLIDYMTPKYYNGGQVNQYGVNTNALSNLSSSGFNMGNFLGGALFGDGSGINLGFQDAMQSRNPSFGPAAGAAGGGFGPGSYGTSTGVMGALSQMGMSDVANDPRLQEYLEDLPQFGMGYSQQIGDIYGSAGQQAGGIRGGARQAAGKSGFAGSGAVQAASQKALGNLGTETARQRRGVVEGYQADLLSAIGDIEAKGEFEFGQDIPDETNNTTNVNPPPTSAALYDGHTITQGGIKWQWNGSNWENMGAG